MSFPLRAMLLILGKANKIIIKRKEESKQTQKIVNRYTTTKYPLDHNCNFTIHLNKNRVNYFSFSQTEVCVWACPSGLMYLFECDLHLPLY